MLVLYYYMETVKRSAIADNIKRLRDEHNLSQRALAEKSDVAYDTLIKIESGANTNPTIETIGKIARALEVGVDDLIS